MKNRSSHPSASFRALRRVFAKRRVSFAYFFGSKAAGRGNSRSDRDIGVQFQKPPRAGSGERRRLQLWSDLSDVWPGEKIDLVDLSEAPLLLRFRVIQGGKLLFSNDELNRIHFEADTMRSYFDRQYYIDRGARQALARVARRGLR